VYYRYDSNEFHPFVEVQKMTPAESGEDTMAVTDAVATKLDTSNSEGSKPSTKPGIKIAIRTKKLKRSLGQTTKKDTNIDSSGGEMNKTRTDDNNQSSFSKTTSHLSKEKHNVEKWSRQQAERRMEVEKDGNLPSSTTNGEDVTSKLKSKPKFRTTAKGEPM
jgi:hypothetical protein